MNYSSHVLASFSFFGNNYSQCATMNLVLERRLEHLNLAVKSNPQAFVACLYLHLVRTNRQEIFIVAQASSHSTQRKSDQTQTTCSVCYVNAQHASIEPI